MKKFVFLSAALLAFSFIQAQTGQKIERATQALQQQAKPEVISFKELEHDFGKIPQGKPVYYSFEIVNNSSEPVKLEDVTAMCGCTTPEWNREPIPAGGTDRIRVGYNSAGEGYFEKFITVTYNGNESKQIKIKGTVWKAPSGSAPANPSVQFLNQQFNKK